MTQCKSQFKKQRFCLPIFFSREKVLLYFIHKLEYCENLKGQQKTGKKNVFSEIHLLFHISLNSSLSTPALPSSKWKRPTMLSSAHISLISISYFLLNKFSFAASSAWISFRSIQLSPALSHPALQSLTAQQTTEARNGLPLVLLALRL